MTTATKTKGGDLDGLVPPEIDDPFARDMAMAQAEMANAIKDSVNPHFRSRYTSYAAVREAVMPAHRHGFATNFIHRIEYTPGGDMFSILRLVVRHRSGREEISERLIVGDTEQQRGSSITYGRRYLLGSYFGIASEEDDDANEASNAGVKQKSAYQARADKDYEALVNEMRKCETRNDLFKWRHEIVQRRAALPDTWRELFDEQCELHRVTIADSEKEEAKT